MSSKDKKTKINTHKDFQEKMNKSIESSDKYELIAKHHFAIDSVEKIDNLETRELSKKEKEEYEFESVDMIIDDHVYVSLRRLEYDENYSNFAFRHYAEKPYHQNSSSWKKAEWAKWEDGKDCKAHYMILDNYPQRVAILRLRKLVKLYQKGKFEVDRRDLDGYDPVRDCKRGSGTYIDFETVRDLEEETGFKLMKIYDYEEIPGLKKIHEEIENGDTQ